MSVIKMLQRTGQRAKSEGAEALLSRGPRKENAEGISKMKNKYRTRQLLDRTEGEGWNKGCPKIDLKECMGLLHFL